jgi:hypothetical protein
MLKYADSKLNQQFQELLCCLQDKEPKGIIPLENITVHEQTVKGSRQHCFEILSANNDVIKACKTDSEGKVVEGMKCLVSFDVLFIIAAAPYIFLE